MSERERWIVYPLLFLALGAGLRDKLIKQTMNDKVICKDLYCERVLSDEVYISSGPQYSRVLHAGRLTIPGVEANSILQQGRPVVTYNPQLLRALNPWRADPDGSPTPPMAPPQQGAPTPPAPAPRPQQPEP